MSAGDRDTLAGIIADEIMKMPYAHDDNCSGSHTAHDNAFKLPTRLG